MKRLIQICVLLIPALVISCQDEISEPSAKKDPVSDLMDFAPTKFEVTSKFNPLTGEMAAFNYDPAQHPDIRINPKNNLNELITFTNCSEAFVGSEPLYTPEATGDLGATAFILTGIGARAASGDVTTLWLRGQEINTTTGALGDEVTWKFGSAPNHTLEVWYEVSPNYSIVGYGLRMNSSFDFTTLKIYYRYWDASLKKFTGSTLSTATGSDPNHATEVEWGTWYSVSDSDQLAHTYVNGVGLRSAGGDLTTMRSKYCLIVP